MKRNQLLKIGIPIATVLLAGSGAFAAYMTWHEADLSTSNGIGSLSGVVVNALTDEPLGNATVMAQDLSAPANSPKQGVVCDARGRFILELEDSKWRIKPALPGYTLQGHDDLGREISIQDGTQFVNAKLKLWPEASIQGRIVAGNVGIQANVELIYENDDSGAENYTFKTLTTDENGTFNVNGAYTGTMSIAVAAEGFANVLLTDIDLTAGQTVDLGDIPMRDGVSLFGHVTDYSNQKGIANASVTIKTSTGQILETTTTSLSGQYRLPPLDMGKVIVTLAADGYHTTSRPLKLSGNANRELDFVLKRSWGLTLDVQNMTARDPIKTHIKITDVTSNEVVYTKILPNGKITLDDFKGGPFLIVAESYDKMTSQTIRLMAGDSARIHLKPFARIEGTAKKSDGTPLTSGEYRYIFKPDPNAEESITPWYALASSEFEITDLQEGFYRVELRKGADEPVASPLFQLRHGDTRHLTMQLTEGGVLKGHVVTTESGFGVRAHVTIEGTSLSARTDRDGYFTIDKLPNRPFTVSIKPDRESEYIKFENIVVKDNTTVEREFRVNSESVERREKRRAQMEERRARGEFAPRTFRNRQQQNTNNTPPWGDGPPPWANGTPPWGDGPPPWANGEQPEIPMNEDGTFKSPPWGDGPPPWANGEQPEIPMNEDGTFKSPPWGDGPPPWANGEQPEIPMNEDGTFKSPPWGDGPPPWANGEQPEIPMNEDGTFKSPSWGDGTPPWENARRQK